MSDKKNLSKIIKSLTDSINLLATYITVDDEEDDEVIELVDEPSADVLTDKNIEDELDDNEDDEEIEIIDDEESEEEKDSDDKDSSKETNESILNPLEPFQKAATGLVGKLLGEDGEKCDEKCDEGIGTAIAGGLAAGAASAVGNKVVKKLIGEDAEVGRDLAKYQEFVDFDMKEYGHISKRTQKFLDDAGLEAVEDRYGDYEVVAKEEDGVDESILNPLEPFQKAATGLVGKVLGGLTEENDDDIFDDGHESDESTINEASEGADAKDIATAVNTFFKESGKADAEKTELAQKIIDAVPAELIDNLIAKFKEVLGDKEIDYKMDREFSKKNIDSTPFDTLGELIDDPEVNKLGKGTILTILGIVALFEPSPVGELIVGVLSMLPSDKFVKIMLALNFPILGLVKTFKDRAASRNEGMNCDAECPECNECNKTVSESYLPEFEDKFGFMIGIGLADDLFYNDNYIIIDTIEDNDQNIGRQIVFVDSDQMIHLYDEAKEEDVYTHFVNDGGETEHEIRVIFEQYVDIDLVSNISIGTGRYMI